MNQFSDLPFKQLMVPPYRKETNVTKQELHIYSTINPVIPPFLPNRKIGKFAKFPSYGQQIEILKASQNGKVE
jgi:hypothetical protein